MIEPVVGRLSEEVEPKLIVARERPKIANMRVNASAFFGLLAVKMQSPSSGICYRVI